MKKRENRVVKSLIAGVLCLSQLQIPVNVLAAEGEPENLALNKTTSASALEVSDGRFTDEMAVDGNREGDSRWSSGALTASSPQWLEVDLGSPQTFNSVSLYWEASAGQAYRLEGRNSADEEWTTFYETENGDGELDVIDLSDPVTYQYVRLYITEGNGRYSSVSLYEIELYYYTDQMLAENALDALEVPASTKENFTLSLGDEETAISWESNSELISVNNETGEATVTLPETTTRVTLTATATHGDAVATKEFTVAVLSEDTMTEAYQIYPTPQSLTMTYETAPLTETVNVVYGSTIDEVTKARVEEVLSEHGMTISEDGAGEGLTQVLVGVNGSGDEADAYADAHNISKNVFSTTENRYDAHVVSIDADGTILILGEDSDAAYYGMATLDQILDEEVNNSITTVVVEDYSDTQYRGIVEGFYGFPYSVEDRLSLMEYMKDNKLNMFVYGPKGDPYHLGNWKDDYPTSVTDEQRKEGQITQDEMKQLTAKAAECNVDFVWSAHPAMQEGIDFTSEAGITQGVTDLMTKFEHMYELGVRQFGIFVDDISMSDAYRDREGHAELIDRVQKALEAEYNGEGTAEADQVKPLYFVPSYYAFDFGSSDRDQYFAALKNVDSDILIGFTGSSVFSNVNSSLMNRMTEYVGRQPVMWWNYPVNDNRDAQLFMQPMGTNYSVENNIQNMGGLLSNPMNQAEASKVAIFGVADYSWNTGDFDAQKNWEAVFATYSDDPEVQDAIRTFATYSATSGDKSGVNSLFNAYRNAVNEGTDPTNAEAIKTEMNKIIDACNTVLALEDGDDAALANFADEVGPWARKLRTLATVVNDCIDVLAAENPLDEWDAYATANTLYIDIPSNPDYKVASQEGQGTTITPSEFEALPADSTVRPFADWIISQARSLYTLPQRGSASVYTNTEVSGLSVTVGDNYAVINGADTITLQPEEYVGINYRSIEPVTSVDADLTDGLVVQGSVNGKEWVTINTAGTATYADDADSYAYIRVKNNGSEAAELSLSSFRINTIRKTEITSARSSTSMYETGTYPISNMYDGDYTTYAWTAANQAVGDTMTYTLNQTIGIDDVTFVFSGSDCLSDGAVIEISADGSQWTTIGEVDRSYLESHNYRYTCDGEGQEAQYVRLRITSINANAWLRIYEVEVNKTTNEQLAQPVAYLADNTYIGEVADRSVSTSYQMATDDVLTYQLIDNLKADEINVLYTSDNAGEEAPTIELYWEEENGESGGILLGTLDGETFSFDVSEYRNIEKVIIRANGNALNVFEIYETGDTYVEAKRADLQSAINTVPEKDESAYTEDSWAAYEEALAHAEELMAGVELSQAEADAAAQAIRDAINNLVENGEQPATDKDALNEAIAAAEALDGEDYTTNSWNALTSALETAKTVAADESATQEEVDNAANALNGAKAALQVKASEAAIDALQNVVDKANALQEDSLAELIAAAQALLDDPANASLTAVVSAMLDLSEAMADLNTDESSDKLKEDLLATIDYIEENILPNLDNVRPGKVQELETAIAQAYQVYNNANATDDEIRAAIRTLSEKAQELWEIVSKAELNALIEAAEAIEADGHTAESYEALQAAIAAAKGTAADDNATTSDVTRAITNLSTAIANLEKITLDTSALEHEIELAEQILANIDDYVASTVEGLQEKADAAKEVLANATTQAEIDEATKTLREARLSARTKADKSALRELIAYANSLDLSVYSDINGLRRALIDAGNVMNEEEATQDEVNAAVEALQAELNALTPKAESSTNADTTNTAAAAQTGLFAGVLAAAAGALLAVRRRKNQE